MSCVTLEDTIYLITQSVIYEALLVCVCCRIMTTAERQSLAMPRKWV